jgi:aminopeptidase C
MRADLIRQTLSLLEEVGMEYVAGRDFNKVMDLADYTLGSFSHDEPDVRKVDYEVFQKTRDGGFEYNDKFYPQEFYKKVADLKLSPYVKPQEAVEAFKAWVAAH